jgi:hypothetical protein
MTFLKHLAHWIYILILLIPILATAPPAQAQMGINLFGFSKHFQDDDMAPPEEINPGLGYHWTFDRGSRTAMEFNLGAYRDSYKELNTHMSLGVRWRVWGPLELGLQALLAQSVSVNHNDPLLMPVPFLTLRHPRLAVNMVYLPKVTSLNRVPTLGLTFTAFPFGSGFVWDGPEQQHPLRRSALEFRLLNPWALDNYRNMGLAWRRLFNEVSGLRLGYNLNGSLSVGREPSSGSYDTELMVHYLRQHLSTRQSSWYFSTGLNLKFSTDNSYSTLAAGSAFLVGWDYRLSQQFNLFLETGATWWWHEESEQYPGVRDWFHSTQSLQPEFSLGLCAWI